VQHTIPLFPLSSVLFPDGALHLQIFEVRYLDLIKRCHQQRQPFGVVSIKQGREVQVPGEVPVLQSVGCTAYIEQFEQVQATFFRVLCRGDVRFELQKVSAGALGVWQGDVTYLPKDPVMDVPSHLQAYADKLGKVIASAQQQGVIDQLPISPPYQLDQCGWLANRYAEALPIRADVKIQLLSEADPLQRLESVVRLMQGLT